MVYVPWQTVKLPDGSFGMLIGMCSGNELDKTCCCSVLLAHQNKMVELEIKEEPFKQTFELGNGHGLPPMVVSLCMAFPKQPWHHKLTTNLGFHIIASPVTCGCSPPML